MKKYFIVTIILLLSVLTSSCEFESKELIELRNEVRFLETEIASLRGSPGFLFGEAFEYVDAGEYAETVRLLEELQTSFPDWNEDTVSENIKIYSEILDKSEIKE